MFVRNQNKEYYRLLICLFLNILILILMMLPFLSLIIFAKHKQILTHARYAT